MSKFTIAKVTGYALIIDKNGMPRIDDPQAVPEIVWGTLTKIQKAHVNAQVQEHLRRYN